MWPFGSKFERNEFLTAVVTEVEGKTYNVHNLAFDDQGNIVGVMLTDGSFHPLRSDKLSRISQLISDEGKSK